MKNDALKGHLVALFTCLFWGTTFICTKVLLQGLRPVEILLIRFCLGLLMLFLMYPHRFRRITSVQTSESHKDKSALNPDSKSSTSSHNLRRKCENNPALAQELTFAGAGLTGVFLYYLLENVSLSYTTASNVGLIVSSAPFFTALFDRFWGETREKLRVNFFLGFLIAMAGIALINFDGSSFEFSPKGDLLALVAAAVWGVYSIVVRRTSSYSYPTILSTRRIFEYGILFMLPAAYFLDFHPDWSLVVQPRYLLNLLFLGTMASALCFVCWNYAVRLIGAVGTSLYIYLQPVVTVIASVLILHEPFTPYTVVGTILTLAGLILSQYKPVQKGQSKS